MFLITYSIKVLFALLAFANTLTPIVWALNNGLALTPPMGWISWERFTCNIDCDEFPNDCINSKLYKDIADRILADGYAELGYNYVNIDDCWSELARDSTGNLSENRTRFPDGIQGLADYAHAKNLMLGIYGDCGTATCAGYPAQLKSENNLLDNNFQRDAETFARWQVDSFKFDGCNLDPNKAESICPQMARAINATKRPILIVCEWPLYMLKQKYNLIDIDMSEPNFTLAAEACNAWRYYEDVEDSWLSILGIIDFTVKIQTTIVKYHGPGHWFDPDQLVIGNFALSLDQARAQMAIWSIWSAPLYMSNDLRDIQPEMAAVLKNRNLIEVNQDKLGIFGLMVAQSSDAKLQAFAKPVEPIRHGCPSFVIVYLNRNTLGNSRDVSFQLRDLLAGLPIKTLVADRYRLLTEKQEGAQQLEPDYCKKLLQVGMTKQRGESSKALLNNKLGSRPELSIEELQVSFRLTDLFADPLPYSSLSLNDSLTLRVNPSGVRAIRLDLVAPQKLGQVII